MRRGPAGRLGRSSGRFGRSSGRSALVAVVVLLTLALAGCGGLPASGPVVDGRRLGDSIQDPVRVSVQGPTPGASQESIAGGFVRAGADTDETRQTGKDYLTPQSVDLWRWSTQDIVIYDSLADGLTVRKVGSDRVEVSVVAIARVTPEGRYQEMAPGTTVKAVFGLTKVSGEWRIQLPSTGFGLWLDSSSFDRLYINENVYYVTLTGRLLVPDSRWFPAGPRLTTSLARAQLEPVPAYLEGAVFTGVPPKAKLAVNAVPVDDSGRAVVDLSAAALEANPDARTAMWAQLTASLSQVGSVTQVSLTAEGAGLELPDGRLTANSAQELGFDQPPVASFDTALLRTGDQIKRIDPRYIPDSAVGAGRPDTKPLDVDVASIPRGWTTLALSTDGKQIAAVGGDGKDLSLWQANTKTMEVAPFGTEITRPAYDSSGYLWVGALGRTGAPQIFVFPPAVGDVPPKAVAVPAPWLAGRRVVSLNVSPDGARLLVATTLPDGTGAQLRRQRHRPLVERPADEAGATSSRGAAAHARARCGLARCHRVRGTGSGRPDPAGTPVARLDRSRARRRAASGIARPGRQPAGSGRRRSGHHLRRGAPGSDHRHERRGGAGSGRGLLAPHRLGHQPARPRPLTTLVHTPARAVLLSTTGTCRAAAASPRWCRGFHARRRRTCPARPRRAARVCLLPTTRHAVVHPLRCGPAPTGHSRQHRRPRPQGGATARAGLGVGCVRGSPRRGSHGLEGRGSARPDGAAGAPARRVDPGSGPL